MRKGTRRVAATVFALGLFAAACGDDPTMVPRESTASASVRIPSVVRYAS